MNASVDMILARGLTAGESAKFDLVKDRLADTFIAAGHDIRVCEGTGEGQNRTIGFVPGLLGPPLLSIPANRFVAASERDLITQLEQVLETLQ